MIYLDTHVIVWLYAGLVEKLSDTAKTLINDHEIYISTIVRLELQYLYEVERITHNSNAIVWDLSSRIGLRVCNLNFDSVITQGLEFSWTRDPFDRIITANAMIGNNILVTKDSKILDNYPNAKW